ncbi:MAG: hypothetical protein AAGI17_07390 [Planctomycetota bacterium]
MISDVTIAPLTAPALSDDIASPGVVQAGTMVVLSGANNSVDVSTSFTWTRDGQTVVDSADVSGQGTDTLSITVNNETTGNYTLSATNPVGTGASAPVGVGVFPTISLGSVDFDGNGVVNISDLFAFINAFTANGN